MCHTQEKRNKKRVLWVTEASYMNSGYSTYSRNVLSRLCENDSFEIYELACYGKLDDVKKIRPKWTVIPNEPANEEEARMLTSDIYMQYGKLKFDRVCLEIKPDIVVDIRDPWHHMYQFESPAFGYFNWVVMPSIDSYPIRKEFAHMYKYADKLCTYCDWTKDMLEKLYPEKKIFTCGFGVDTNKFSPPTDKRKVRASVGLEEDIVLFGTVMRNQRRKLFPNVIHSFARFIDKIGELGKNVYLWLHTAYPDMGWDLPLLINESGVGNKILLTYKCTACNNFFPSFYCGPMTRCRYCGNNSKMTHPGFAVSDEQLAQIYRCFDLYIQYSICEGAGIPPVEAAACGVPIVMVDYSAMSSVGRKLNAKFVKPAAMFREPETMAYRAFPDDNELIDIMVSYINDRSSFPSQNELVELVKKYFDYDNVAKKWADVLLNIRNKGRWYNTVANMPNLDARPSNNMSPEQFVKFLFFELLREPELFYTYRAQRMIMNLMYGVEIHNYGGPLYYDEHSLVFNRMGINEYSFDKAYNEVLNMAKNKYMFEQARLQSINRRV